MKQILTFFFLLGALTLKSQWKPIGPAGGNFTAGLSYNSSNLFASTCGLYKINNISDLKIHSNSMPSGKIQGLINYNNVIFASIWLKGIFTSTDGGISWKASTKNIWMYDLKTGFAVANGKLFFKRSYDSIAFSSDMGKNWTVKYVPIQGFETIFGADNNLYTYGNYSGGYGLCYSSDDGQTWNKSNLLNKDYVSYIQKIGATFYAFGRKCYSSADGIAWSALGDTIPHPDLMKESFVPGSFAYDGTWIYGINGGNIYIHTVRWKPGDTKYTLLNNNLDTKGNLSSIFATDKALFVSRLEGTFFSTDNGNSFSPCNMNTVFADQMVDISTYKNKMAGGYQDKLYDILDEDISLNTKKPQWLNSKTLYTTFLNKGNLILISKGGLGVYYTDFSSDDGQTNKQLYYNSYSVPKLELVDDTLHFLGYYQNAPFAAILNDSGRIKKLIDGGNFSYNFYFADIVKNKTGKFCMVRNVSSGNIVTALFFQFNYSNGGWYLPPYPYSIKSYSANCLESWGDKLYMGTTRNGIFVNSDSTKTWLPFNEGIENRWVNDIKAKGDTLIAATDSGIYILKKGETLWKNIAGNLIVGNVMKVRFTTHHLYVLLDGGGAWRLPLDGFISDIGKAKSFNNSSLKIYPNPAKTYLNIELDEPIQSSKTINIIDLQGRIVTSNTIENNKGSIDLQLVSDGIYIVNVIGTTGTFSSKLVIQR